MAPQGKGYSIVAGCRHKDGDTGRDQPEPSSTAFHRHQMHECRHSMHANDRIADRGPKPMCDIAGYFFFV